MTTPIEDLQAQVAAMRLELNALRADVGVLQGESRAAVSERQRVHEWLSTQRRDTTPDDKPRDIDRS